MADVEATDMAQPVVETRATFKKPATQKATPAVKPPSKRGNSAQIKKRQSIKRRPAAAQQPQDEAVSTASKKRPASKQRGAEGCSDDSEAGDEAAPPVEVGIAAPALPADAHDVVAGGAGKGQASRASPHPDLCHRPLLMLMEDGAYMNTKGEACDEYGRLLRRRGARGGWNNKPWSWWVLQQSRWATQHIGQAAPHGDPPSSSRTWQKDRCGVSCYHVAVRGKRSTSQASIRTRAG
jgi:hypothetical protein